MPEFNFEKDQAIDLDDLHEEWRAHAQIRHKYAGEVSHLDKILKKANEDLNSVKSRLIRQCKEENPKFTVQQIDGFCIEHKDYIKARDNVIESEYNLNMAKNAVKAFDDRKSALENEVKLWLGNYFATPTEHRMAEPGKRIDVMNTAKNEKVQEGRQTVNRRRKRK